MEVIYFSLLNLPTDPTVYYALDRRITVSPLSNESLVYKFKHEESPASAEVIFHNLENIKDISLFRVVNGAAQMRTFKQHPTTIDLHLGLNATAGEIEEFWI